MTIKFQIIENNLCIRYTPEQDSIDFIDDSIKEKGYFLLKKIFSFSDIYQKDGSSNFVIFKLATLQENYWVVDKEILGLKYDLKLSNDLSINKKTFTAERKISIFKKLDKLMDEPIVVGGGDEGAIPIEVFNDFLKKFPTTTELNHYASYRIENVLGEYFSTMSSSEEKLINLLRRKRKSLQERNSLIELNPILKEIEINKFEYAYQEIKQLLEQPENFLYEKEWQEKIINLIKLIFPKYIAVCGNVKINDFYTEENKTKNRYIDLLLIDFNGNIDVLELKRPFDNKILCSNPKSCRDNYIPHIELSTAIMQAEKYIFHLNKWGKAGEKELTENLKKYLPNELNIKISNPKTIILLGRSHKFDRRQQLDFEIIKRQFSHVADIMSYDDLLNRVSNILTALKDDN